METAWHEDFLILCFLPFQINVFICVWVFLPFFQCLILYDNWKHLERKIHFLQNVRLY